MAYAGARGRTAQQIAQAFRFLNVSPEVHLAFGSLLKELNAPAGEGCELHLANSLWGQKGTPFKNEFESLCRERYDANISRVDFTHSSGVARRQINDWVKAQTHGEIAEIAAPDSPNSDTVLAVLNAAYFRGSWAGKFEKSETRPQPFYLDSRNSVSVSMMRRSSIFGYSHTQAFQALELPYLSNRLSMVIILPRKVDGLAEVEKGLDVARFEALRQMEKVAGVVELPRFKCESGFGLEESLAAMGMTHAFSQQQADFSGITAAHRLWIGAAMHKACVTVGEEGTVAAAGTYKGFPKGETPVFVANHPFLFFIVHKPSGTLIFLGRINDPSKVPLTKGTESNSRSMGNTAEPIENSPA